VCDVCDVCVVNLLLKYGADVSLRNKVFSFCVCVCVCVCVMCVCVYCNGVCANVRIIRMLCVCV